MTGAECCVCGKLIHIERLKALPHAVTCSAECSIRHRQNLQNARRKAARKAAKEKRIA